MKKGIVRINAGAGTGKTTVVVFRVLNLLCKGVLPEEILLISFTNTAAAEMRERIEVYSADMGLDMDLAKLRVETFHGFGCSVLRDKWHELGFLKEPQVIDNISRAGIISEILEEIYIPGLDYRNFTLRIGNTLGALPKTEKAFRLIKEERIDASEKLMSRMEIGEETADMFLKAFGRYEAALKEKGLMEFSDMESMIFDVFEKDPSYLENLGIKHFIVDEFQDTNEREIGILKKMREIPSFESLMAVGDDSQSIFGFKATTPEYIVRFSETMGEEVDTITLTENFRSRKDIIDFANSVNSRNAFRVDKELIPTLEKGRPVEVNGFLCEEDQYEYVARKIREKLEEGVRPEAIAVIARKKTALSKYEEILKREGIPSRKAYPEKILDNCRVKGAIALFKAIDDPENEIDLLLYLNCRVHGNVMDMAEESVSEMMEGLKEEIRAFNLLEDVEKKAKMGEWLRAIDSNSDEVYLHFLELLSEHETFSEMSQFIHDFERYGEAETYRRQKAYPGIQLITAHSSKGLEYPIVFDDINDYEVKGMTEEEIEEARRLLFVSSTRAKDELYVVGTFVAYGPEKQHVYNRFLLESFDTVGKSIDIISVENSLKERKMLKKAENNMIIISKPRKKIISINSLLEYDGRERKSV